MIQSHKDLLKSHDLSVTAVRLALLQALHMRPHAGADTIFNIVKKEIVTTSKQAIYNNLHALVERGLIREIKPKGQPSLYEARVGDNHHHIVCRACGAIADTDCITGVRSCLTPSDDHGFMIDEAEVTFWGMCPSCQKSLNEKRRKS